MNAVIYARYSSHSQTEQSIEGQLRDNHAWAAQQGVTVVHEYIDRAMTGKVDTRPDFQRMIADASKRQFDMVIVWKLDRFARNRYDSAIYKAKLKKYGVRVVSVKEAITDSPEGIILEGLLESMAEYYSANLSQNIKRGQRENMAKGYFIGGQVPYGYKIVDKKLVPDDKTAPVIRYVFEQYAQGTTMREIIDTLNARGVRGKTGKPLTYTTFCRALNNPVYIGSYTYNGQVVEGLATPIIDEDTFAKAQARAKSVARAPAASKAKVDYLLQGKLFCGDCGFPMTAECGKSRNKDTYYYYSCANRKHNHACKKKNERKDDLEAYVVNTTLRYVLSPGRIAQVAKAVVREYNKEFSDSRVTEYEKQLAQIDREIEKLVDALIDAPKVAHAKIYARMESLDAQKTEVSADLARLKIATEISLTEPEVRAWLKSICTADPTDPSTMSSLIDTFVNSIYLYDDRIIIFYNINTAGSKVTYPALQQNEKAAKPGSDLTANGGANEIKFEPYYVFVDGIFGCVCFRDQHEI